MLSRSISRVTNSLAESTRAFFGPLAEVVVSAQGVGRSNNIKHVPAIVTQSRTIPTMFLVSSSISFVPLLLNIKKTNIFPIKLEEMDIAQNIPEFRDIVDSSEFRDKKFP